MKPTVAHDITSTFHIDPADIELYVPQPGRRGHIKPGTHRSWYPLLWLNLNRHGGRWDIILSGRSDDQKDVIFEARDQPDLGRLGEAFEALFAIAEHEADREAFDAA